MSPTLHIHSLLGLASTEWVVMVFCLYPEQSKLPKHRLSKVLEMFPEDLSADSKAISPGTFFLHHSCFKHSPALLKITFLLGKPESCHCWKYPGRAHFISKLKEFKDFQMSSAINCNCNEFPHHTGTLLSISNYTKNCLDMKDWLHWQ